MKYAVIEISGEQHLVQEGQVLNVEKIEGNDGSNLKIDKILLFVDGEKVEIGKPYLDKIKVDLQIIKQYKDKKLDVYKYRSKSRYRRKIGHRQQLTQVKINKIG